jgi:hypothetical protein
MDKRTAVLVEKSAITNTRLIDQDPSPLPDGTALLRIESFALTTNNVTYAATGDQLKYWQFFPSGEEGWGIVPVWGFATVEGSRCPDIEPGERLYGYFPMASHLVVLPGRIREASFADVSPHRQDLAATYNTYIRLGGESRNDSDLEDKRAILYPLYATSYLLFDFLGDNDWFGAAQIIIGSASSKTGIGLAQFLAGSGAPKVVGLTSSGNREFVEKLGACDQVVTYDDIAVEIKKIPSVYVDMAGNAAVRKALHVHLGEAMKYSCAVGMSHWDKFAPTGELPGARPEFFFAPAQIRKRRDEWGPGVLEGRIDEAWKRLARDRSDWLTIEENPGLDQAMAIYSELALGRSDPRIGHIVRLVG